jgi:hypothetical protein
MFKPIRRRLMQNPKQSTTVHVEKLDGELCLYDWQRLKVHNLNSTAAQVWEMCDGQTTPQQIAAQLKGDLSPVQAEELVWLTLKRLEQAKLLEDKVVKPSGCKVLTRREMLAKLGVAAVMLPVISTIVAPSPVAAQSPHAGVTALVLYEAGGTYNGDLGGRAGADATCQASGNRPAGYANVRAFITVDDPSDTIDNMPANYGIPTNLPVRSLGGTIVANNWADLVGGGVIVALNTAGVVGSDWWDGTGGAGTPSPSRCANWTDGTNAQNGSCGNTGAGNIFPGAIPACDTLQRLLCIAY